MTKSSIEEILSLLPHRAPFLMVDKILDIQKGKTITCQKNLSYNEPFFQGHFPNNPIMPGVLQMESIAQTGLLFIYLSLEAFSKQPWFPRDTSTDELRHMTPYLVKVTNLVFKRPVLPGDVMIVKVIVDTDRPLRGKRFFSLKGFCTVNDHMTAEANFVSVLQPQPVPTEN